MTALKMGYVGAGFMAQRVHLPNFMGLPEVEMMALAEARPLLGEKVARRLGIPRLYRSHEELAADPEVEAVAVSGPQTSQGDVARDLLLAGKHVFVEKPLAVSVEQAEDILAAQQRSGRKLMVAYMKRYDAGNELAKEILDRFRQSGEIGQPLYVRAHSFCGDWIAGLDTPMDTTDEPLPPALPARWPAWLPEEQRGRYVNYLQEWTHNVNLLRFFLNAGDDARVEAVSLDEDGETGVVIFKMAGIRATLESAETSHFAYDEHIQFYFKDGWVHVWGPPLLHKNLPARVEIYLGGEVQSFEYPMPKDRWSWAYKREAEHFVRAVLRDEPVLSSGRDTLTDVRLFEEIYRQRLRR